MSVGVAPLTSASFLMRHIERRMEGPCPGYQNVSKDPWDWVCLSFPQLLSTRLFSRIFREQTATNLVNAGAASVSDLSLPQYESLLSQAQKIGVLYGDHMKTPIPRAEAEEIAVRRTPISLVRTILITAEGLHSLSHILQL